VPDASSDLSVSVAVPTCNGAAHLAEALHSIMRQEGVAFELIVCDDRSDDETIDVARATAGDRARIEINTERLGLAGNWNRGVGLSRARHVTVFHQDDVMLPGHLAAQAAAFRADPAIALVASASEVIDAEGSPIAPDVVEPGGLGPRDTIFEPGALAAQMGRGNPLRCSAVAVDRAAFAEVGGFDPAYQYLPDWDLWLRLSRRWKVAWLSCKTVQVRWHAASETHRFAAGTTDLDETVGILAEIFARDLAGRADAHRLHRTASERLGRAFLNRAHDALRAGRTELARDCLRRALDRAPALLATILRDPRLALQMTALALAPRLAGQWFRKQASTK
jgi:glycosyltransferase involved in cell wall biosynthesis